MLAVIIFHSVPEGASESVRRESGRCLQTTGEVAQVNGTEGTAAEETESDGQSSGGGGGGGGGGEEKEGTVSTCHDYLDQIVTSCYRHQYMYY